MDPERFMMGVAIGERTADVEFLLEDIFKAYGAGKLGDGSAVYAVLQMTAAGLRSLLQMYQVPTKA